MTNSAFSASQKDDVLVGQPSDAQLTRELLHPLWQPPRGMLAGLLVSGAGTAMLLLTLAYIITTGIGVWGNTMPVVWGFDIINFVWWIGIGHAGTFISAVLYLLGQSWRTSISRLTETMTLMAVANAGLYPIVHLGRAWYFYWLLPYPATTGFWPQFKSALTWDIVAVLTYLTTSAVFWYIGLLPDLASARDHAPTLRRRRIYGVFALGWRGQAQHWRALRCIYGLLAGLATPLVVSVHTIVSFDFATTHLPGWHTTLFPPYFVVGAVFSGFGMVVVLTLPLRRWLNLHAIITPKHLDNMALMLLVAGSIVAYAYGVEIFLALMRDDPYESYLFFVNRPTGGHPFLYWLMLACNVLAPQLLWFKKIRSNYVALFGIAVAVNVGMWLERFIIIVVSLEREFLASSWHIYKPSVVDAALFAGTFSFFVFGMLLVLRFVPIIPISEMKELSHELSEARHA